MTDISSVYHLTYAVQPSPDGLAQAFIIGEEFIGDDTVAMVLGDNIFAGHGLKKRLKAAVENAEAGKGATVFGYYVDDPERFRYRRIRPGRQSHFHRRKAGASEEQLLCNRTCISMITKLLNMQKILKPSCKR